MTNERYKQLMNDESEPLTREEMREGWHFCQRTKKHWLVGPGMSRWGSDPEMCRCGHTVSLGRHVADSL